MADALFSTAIAALDQLMPEKPKLASIQAGLSNILVAHYHHHAWEVCEHTSPFHVLEVIETPKLVPHQRRMGDYTQSGNMAGGNVFLCPAHADYRIRWEKDLEFTLIGLQPNLIAQEFGLRSLDLPPLAIQADPTIQLIVRNIREDLQAGCPIGSIYSDSAALFLTAHLLKLVKIPQSLLIQDTDILPNSSLKEVLAYLHEHYADSKAIRLGDLAKQANLSQFHFHRLFKQSTGKTPRQYVLKLRIDQAKHLLRYTQQNLTQIAIACGFSRASELNKQFTKLEGTDPGSFRRSAQ
jgi:AraC family transcriptional regulator